jgi:hypothetical protein
MGGIASLEWEVDLSIFWCRYLILSTLYAANLATFSGRLTSYRSDELIALRCEGLTLGLPLVFESDRYIEGNRLVLAGHCLFLASVLWRYVYNAAEVAVFSFPTYGILLIACRSWYPFSNPGTFAQWRC